MGRTPVYVRAPEALPAPWALLIVVIVRWLLIPKVPIMVPVFVITPIVLLSEALSALSIPIYPPGVPIIAELTMVPIELFRWLLIDKKLEEITPLVPLRISVIVPPRKFSMPPYGELIWPLFWISPIDPLFQLKIAARPSWGPAVLSIVPEFSIRVTEPLTEIP